MYKYRRRDVWTTILILASLSLPSLAGSVEESLRSPREEGSEGDLDNKEVLEGSDLLSEGKEEGVSDKCAGVTCHNGDCVESLMYFFVSIEKAFVDPQSQSPIPYSRVSPLFSQLHTISSLRPQQLVCQDRCWKVCGSQTGRSSDPLAAS